MIHRFGDLRYLAKTLDRKVHPTIHHRQDHLELQEVLLLCRSQRIRIEERDDHPTKIFPTKHVESEQIFLVIVMSAVPIDVSAAEVLLQHLKYVQAAFTLNNRKPRLHLPTTAHSLVSLNRAAEATFSVDEADDPLLETWPFLLIVRTGRIFTAHVISLLMRCDTNEYRRILGVSSI